MFTEIRKRVKKIGQPPGTAMYTGDPSGKTPTVNVIVYGRNDFQEKLSSNFEDCLPLIEKTNDNIWINVEGLQDARLIQDIAARFALHPLTVEDILNVEQRPKVEEFTGYIFITLKV